MGKSCDYWQARYWSLAPIIVGRMPSHSSWCVLCWTWRTCVTQLNHSLVPERQWPSHKNYQQWSPISSIGWNRCVVQSTHCQLTTSHMELKPHASCTYSAVDINPWLAENPPQCYQSNQGSSGDRGHHLVLRQHPNAGRPFCLPVNQASDKLLSRSYPSCDDASIYIDMSSAHASRIWTSATH